MGRMSKVKDDNKKFDQNLAVRFGESKEQNCHTDASHLSITHTHLSQTGGSKHNPSTVNLKASFLE